MIDYWQTQTDKPLFDDLLWSKPEQKSLAGSLGIIGGSKSAFSSISFAEQAAKDCGVGETKILAPDALRPLLKSLTNANFADSNAGGGFAQSALPLWFATNSQTNATLIAGDLGKNPETTNLVNNFLTKADTQKPIIITRDAIDLCLDNPQTITSLVNVIAVMSFRQLQKLFRKILYPIVLVHTIQLAKLVEALHKFTITYPLTICVFHEGQMIIATDGQIISTPLTNPLEIWQGKTAARVATWSIWSPTKLFAATATSFYKNPTKF